jgi:hypothetical protein
MPESFVSRGLVVTPAQPHLLFTVMCFMAMVAPQNWVNEASANGFDIRKVVRSAAQLLP